MTSLSHAADNQPSNINYQFDFERFLEHLVNVTLRFTADTDAPSLWLPAWIPGSYLMREFARNITAVHYEILDKELADNQIANHKDPKCYRAQKTDKHTWQLPHAKAGQTISVYYEVYCYDLSVRTAYVDQQRLYGNFTSLALAVAEQEQSPIQVSLMVPEAFFMDKNKEQVLLAWGLKATYLQSDEQNLYSLQADSYHELIDYPFEIAIQEKFDFIIQDNQHQTLSHQFFLAGKHTANKGR